MPQKVFGVMENITKIAKEYPYVGTTDIDNNKFNLILKSKLKMNKN